MITGVSPWLVVFGSVSNLCAFNSAHTSASGPQSFIFYLNSLGWICFLLGHQLEQPCFLKALWKVAESSCECGSGTYSREMREESWETIWPLKAASISYDFSFPMRHVFDSVISLYPCNPHTHPLHYTHTNIFSWLIFTLCVCNFLCLEFSFTF